MIRTEWLNLTREELVGVLRTYCNCAMAKKLADLQDTAAEADARGLRGKRDVLHRNIRRTKLGCNGKHIFKAGPRGGAL
jgi:hypothetical protein